MNGERDHVTSHSDDAGEAAGAGKAGEGAKPAGAPPAADRAAPPRKDPPAPARRRSRAGLWLLTFIIALVIGAVAAILLMPRLAERVPFLARLMPASTDQQAIDNLLMDVSGLDNTVAALTRRLESQARRIASLGDESAAHGARLLELEERLAALDSRMGAAPAEPAADANVAGGNGAADRGNLAARIDMLTLRVGQLESAFVPLTERAERTAELLRSQERVTGEQERLAAAVADLENRLAAIEETSSGDRRGTLIALSFAALRDAANRGRPFTAEYEALHGILAESERTELLARVRGIAPFAASGVPTQASLRGSFADLSARIIRASHLPEDAAWWQRAWASLRGVVVLRPTGEVKGDRVEAVVARAERRLAANDLAAAVREISGLPPSALNIAEGWLHDARNRLRLDETMSQFANALLRGAAADLDNARPGRPPDPPGADRPDPQSDGEGA